MTQNAENVRTLRAKLKHAEEDLAVVDQILDELGVDSETARGGRYRTMGRMRRLATEVKRLRRVEHGDV